MNKVNGMNRKSLFIGNRKRKQKGAITLAEVALGLLVSALALAAGYAALTPILSSYRAGKVTEELNMTIPAIQASYQSKTSFTGLSTAQVALNGWIGSSFIESANGKPSGGLVTQWGTLTFEAASNGTQGKGTLNNIPSNECRKIATAFASDQFLSATVNGTAVKTTANNLDLTAVGTQCSATATNIITFNFSRA
ncbi:type 4 pilus major pilin [Pseudomonas fulva]|uniref:type 4 pilus major pilin n=1 Tax=Pseudomonas fulva TaxID=47880 RepID=UPI002DBE0975|nr:type 4 pilus major pilin [Pseudomonas fulva]MEB8059287.1 hypothetical protein [Pseudomonas fulva]